MIEIAITSAIVAIAIFVLTSLFEYFMIPLLRKLKVEQLVRSDGPDWHKKKNGTPTMGGLGFVFATLIVMAGFFLVRAYRGDSSSFIPLALTLAYAASNAAIGFVDDYCKLLKHDNEGLTEAQKFFLQLVMAAAYLCVMTYTGNLDTLVTVPFFNTSIELGWFYYPLALLVLTGVVNGGNITDGVDGLASSVTAVMGVLFIAVAFLLCDLQLSLVGSILVGTTLGFLIYNRHPAKVFMGDTGSLFFGAIVIAAAFQTDAELIGLIVAAVYIIEMLSSFLQKMVFKITRIMTGKGRRIFRIAPLHHLFESYGWRENQVVTVFALAETVFCMIAFWAYLLL